MKIGPLTIEWRRHAQTYTTGSNDNLIVGGDARLQAWRDAHDFLVDGVCRDGACPVCHAT